MAAWFVAQKMQTWHIVQQWKGCNPKIIKFHLKVTNSTESHQQSCYLALLFFTILSEDASIPTLIFKTVTFAIEGGQPVWLISIFLLVTLISSTKRISNL